MISSFISKFRFSDAYTNILKEIYNLNLYSPKKTNLDKITEITSYLHNPHNFFDTIHIAGTNGKGSVSKKLSSILIKSGYKVGTFTSPHISSFRERIQINNEKIKKDEVVSLFKQIQKICKIKKCPVTYFEFITAMAFQHFKQHKIDFGIIEVGLGGDLDATNIINPLLSIITSIGYDHMNLLGNTLEEISARKAGIIKPNRPAVLGYDIPTKNVFYNYAKLKGAICYPVKIKGKSYDDENSNTVKLSIDLLRKFYPLKFTKVTDESISFGLKQRPRCRMEKVFDSLPELKSQYKGKISKIYLDVGHNPHGISKLLDSLKKENPDNKNVRVVCAFSKGNDVKGILHLLHHHNVKVNYLTSTHPRVHKYTDLINMTKAHLEDTSNFDDINTAVDKRTGGDIYKILNLCKNNEIVLICGTFFIMKDIRKKLGYNDDIDPFELNESFIPSQVKH